MFTSALLSLASFFGVSAGPTAIMRFGDGKVFYQRDDGSYMSDDGEELSVTTVNNVLWGEDCGHDAVCAEDIGSLGGYADGGHASG